MKTVEELVDKIESQIEFEHHGTFVDDVQVTQTIGEIKFQASMNGTFKINDPGIKRQIVEQLARFLIQLVQ